MRITLLPLVAALLSAPVSASQVAPGRSADGLFPYPIASRTLPNGLRVAVVKTDERGMFAIREVMGVGSRDEVELGYSGFAHFFEHMMFRGTERFPPDKRGALLTGHGVNEGGSTSDDVTIYRLSGPKAALKDVIELEGDRYQNLSYTEGAFRTEAQAVLGEYNKNISNPSLRAWFKLRSTSFKAHPYRHTPIGTLEDIKKMPERYAFSKKFFKRFYTPDNMLLIVSGDVNPDEVFALVEKHFGAWKGKRDKTKITFDKPIKKERRSVVLHDAPTAVRAFTSWRVPANKEDPKSDALCAILEAYLFSDASQLYKKLVIDEQRISRLGTWWWPHKDTSLFPVFVQLRDGQKLDPVVDAIQAALDDIKAGKIDAARFNDVKSHITYAQLMRLTSAEAVGEALANAASISLDPHDFGKSLEAVQARTPEELAAFVKTHFGKDARVVTHVEYKGGAK